MTCREPPGFCDVSVHTDELAVAPGDLERDLWNGGL